MLCVELGKLVLAGIHTFRRAGSCLDTCTTGLEESFVGPSLARHRIKRQDTAWRISFLLIVFCERELEAHTSGTVDLPFVLIRLLMLLSLSP